MTQDEFSLLFHRAQVNLVAFKMLYEPEAFEAMKRMVEMAINEEREACAKVFDAMADQMVEDMEPSTAIAWVRSKAAEIRARGNT